MNYSLQDIHRKSFEEAFESLLAGDLAWLLTQRERFRSCPCPVCGSEAFDRNIERQELNYASCKRCGLLQLLPAPNDDLHLEYIRKSRALQYWRESMPADLRASRKPLYRERAEWLVNSLRQLDKPLRRIVEIGAGNGEFADVLLGELRVDCLRMVLVEPQPLALALPQVKVLTEPFETWAIDDQFDVVVAFEVLEHILDPNALLAHAGAALRPGGVLALTTPNADSFEVDTLGGLSTTLLFDHVRIYTPHSLRVLLDRHGFDVRDLTTPGRFDVAMVERLYADGKLPSVSPAVRFLLDSDAQTKTRFQQFLQTSLQSSHMRCVAVRR